MSAPLPPGPVPSFIRDGMFVAAALERPAVEPLVELLRHRAAEVRATRARLDTPEDPEALHDFRVAIRRLRSLLRAYRPALPDLAPRKLRRALRRLARATNASRDIEVKLVWLERNVPTLRPRDRVGGRWLIRRLTEARAEADAHATRVITRRFDDTLERLTRRLDEMPLPEPFARTLRSVTAVRLIDVSKRLSQQIDQVHTIADQDEAHRTRIVGKRVRYLLEPLSAALPEAGTAVAELKDLQDALGEMHDAEVLARALAEAMEAGSAERGKRVAELVREGARLDRAALRRERRRDPMPGLLALADLVQERRDAAWHAVATAWLTRRADRLDQPLAAVQSRLEHVPEAGVEIERKFLLSARPDIPAGATALVIEQGYLPGDVIQERLRRVETGDGIRYWRTIKTGNGLVRQELEEETQQEVFDRLWPLTEGRRLRKRRYAVPEGAWVWEVDEFLDRDLVLAEVELSSEADQPALPDWLGPLVVRDVTGEAGFVNVNLAR